MVVGGWSERGSRRWESTRGVLLIPSNQKIPASVKPSTTCHVRVCIHQSSQSLSIKILRNSGWPLTLSRSRQRAHLSKKPHL